MIYFLMREYKNNESRLADLLSLYEPDLMITTSSQILGDQERSMVNFEKARDTKAPDRRSFNTWFVGAAVGVVIQAFPLEAAANDNLPGGGKPTPSAASGGGRTETSGYLVAVLQKGKDRRHIDGLSPEFQRDLVALFKAMPDDICVQVRIMSGYRSVARQRELFEAAVRKYGSPAAAHRWVAPPGRSKHNIGLAVDLTYATDLARVWVHANARRFGLHFPMSWENWHIEPIAAR